MEHRMWVKSLLSHLEGELNTEPFPSRPHLPGVTPILSTTMPGQSLLTPPLSHLLC